MRSLARFANWLFGRRPGSSLYEHIQVKQQLEIVATERGKVVSRHAGHNIFLDVGREWLARFIGLAVMPPYGTFAVPGDYPNPHRFPRYLGFGIGGNKQFYPKAAFSQVPLVGYANANPAWPPQFTQTDTDPGVFAMEAPCVMEMNGHLVLEDGCKWLTQIDTPTFPGGSPGEIRFSRIVMQNEISVAPFDLVPISEVMLFVDDPDPNFPYKVPLNPGSGIAYDTLNTISKSNATALQLDWTFRF